MTLSNASWTSIAQKSFTTGGTQHLIISSYAAISPTSSGNQYDTVQFKLFLDGLEKTFQELQTPQLSAASIGGEGKYVQDVFVDVPPGSHTVEVRARAATSAKVFCREVHVHGLRPAAVRVDVLESSMDVSVSNGESWKMIYQTPWLPGSCSGNIQSYLQAYLEYLNSSHSTVDHEIITALEFNDGQNCPISNQPLGSPCEIGWFRDLLVKRTNGSDPFDAYPIMSDGGVAKGNTQYRLQIWARVLESGKSLAFDRAKYIHLTYADLTGTPCY